MLSHVVTSSASESSVGGPDLPAADCQGDSLTHWRDQATGRRRAAGFRSGECPNRVKPGNTRCEQMSSVVHPTTDSSRTSQHVRSVPIVLKKSFLACD
jgi:hypothetical protein